MDGEQPKAVVLVEGLSDQAAVEALAERRGLDLRAERIWVVPIGGAQGIGRYLDRFRAVKLAGLCDEADAPDFARGLERAGLGSNLRRADNGAARLLRLRNRLEEELIRAAGVEGVLRVTREQGNLARFRTLQKQAWWRGRPVEEQLHRFMGSGGRRKIRYARLLV